MLALTLTPRNFPLLADTDNNAIAVDAGAIVHTTARLEETERKPAAVAVAAVSESKRKLATVTMKARTTRAMGVYSCLRRCMTCVDSHRAGGSCFHRHHS